MKRFIVIRTQFQAMHRSPECPIEEASFLRYPHSHIFHVEVKIPVTHSDRDKEFIVEKRKLDNFLRLLAGADKDLGRTSCEDICDKIKEEMGYASMISVFEDGENGAEVYYD